MYVDVIDAKFRVTVLSRIKGGFVLNSQITGEVMYHICSAKYLSFTIGVQSVAVDSFESSRDQ